MRIQLGEVSGEELLVLWRIHSRSERSRELGRPVLVAPDIYEVPSQWDPDRKYTTDVRAGTCDCDDWTHRGSVSGVPCKHLIRARREAQGVG